MRRELLHVERMQEAGLTTLTKEEKTYLKSRQQFLHNKHFHPGRYDRTKPEEDIRKVPDNLIYLQCLTESLNFCIEQEMEDFLTEAP